MLPFGTWERVLAAQEKPFQDSLTAASDAEKYELIAAPNALRFPAALVTAVEEQLRALASPVPALEVLAGAARVWASQYGALALSAGVDSVVQMAVLIQPTAPAAFAFVTHTADPVTQQPNVVCGEVVPGLGEALVGNLPGKALRFRAPQSGQGSAGPIEVQHLCAKRLRIDPSTAASVMVRSDSTGEDLEGFAGAGIYESVLVGGDPELDAAAREGQYHFLGGCQLMYDAGFREEMLRKITVATETVRAQLGEGDWDVEGCLGADMSLTIVQARPQIL